MPPWLLKLVELREEGADEPLDSLVAIRRFRPIEHGQNAADRQGIDRFVLIDQLWVIGRRKVCREVGFGNLALERNREKVEAAIALKFGHGANGTSGHIQGGLDFSRTETLVGRCLVEGRELRLYPELFEDQPRCEICPAAFLVDVDLFA